MRASEDDDETFSLGSTIREELGAVVGGEHARYGMEADRRRRFVQKVEAWAARHGLAVVEGTVVAMVDDVEVSMALFEMTEEMAVLRATALSPASISMSAEPASRSWTSSLVARLRRKSAATGDADFDGAFQIRTSDEPAMRQILAEEVRAGLLAIDAWCRIAYADGRIELRLDSAALSGAHLRRGLDVVSAMARTRIQKTAYRS